MTATRTDEAPDSVREAAGASCWTLASFDSNAPAGTRSVRLLLLATGTLATAHLPFWLNWLRTNRPQYAVAAGLTDTAHHFVSSTAVGVLTGTPVVANSWGDDGAPLQPLHTTLATEYDAIFVYPASVDFLSALAAGSGSRPFTLALLGTSVPVVVAPSFPPGVAGNPIVQALLTRLAAVPNYYLVRPVRGRSRSIGVETEVTAPLWDAVAVLERVLEDQAGCPDPLTSRAIPE